MKLTGSKAIIKCLELEGVDVIFGYPGAAIAPVYDDLLNSNIRHVLVRQEQGAAHMASGYARATGKTGVCMVTSGPGATNLITGIATAYLDSIPIVAITGQVSTEVIGRDVFQEVDTTGSTAPFCKHNYLVKNTEDLPRIIKEAFHIAGTGRPGPVLIDIPFDVQKKEINFSYPSEVDIRGYKPTFKGHGLQIKRISEAIEKSNKPLICAGGGIISANASRELLEVADVGNIPVITTMMGKGAIPFEHGLYFGMAGVFGVEPANEAVKNCDLLIIVGAKVGDRTMYTGNRFSEETKIVHIDVDPAEIGKNIEADYPVVGDVRQVLGELIKVIKSKDNSKWLNELKNIKDRTKNDFSDVFGEEYINPRYVLSKLSQIGGDDLIVTTDVGQHQMWAANNCMTNEPRTYISSCGLGTMGYGLPSAVGAKIGKPKNKVVVVSGDGSFQMSMHDLATMKQAKAYVKIVLFNNRRLGMVRELQKNIYAGRYSAVEFEENPDFIKLAEAYGVEGIKVTNNKDVENAINKLFSDDKPFIAEFMIDPEESSR